MSHYQPGILATPVPAHARHLFFDLECAAALPAALDQLLDLVDGRRAVAGLGSALVQALGARPFAAMSGVGVDNPSTQHALWLWLHGEDRGELLQRTQILEAALAPALRLVHSTEAFRHQTGHDLTGYEDGTENPQGDAALQAALISQVVPGLQHGSFAVVQHWQHDLPRFNALPPQEQDHIFGRRKSDNEELDDAPLSSHVKRTAQESFSPEAFVVRRSMPWIEGANAGLVFLSFAHNFDGFEAQLRRMSGLEDGITDALYRFSRPISGGYYWCPPLSGERLDLHLLR
jgi:putative iron-dependent peroxidase